MILDEALPIRGFRCPEATKKRHRAALERTGALAPRRAVLGGCSHI